MELSSIKHIYSSRKRIVIALAVLLMLNISAQYFVRVIQSDQLSILYKNAQQRVTKDYIERVRAEGARAEKTLSDLESWRKHVYSKRDFARYVGELLELVADNNLTVSSITYKPASIDTNKLLPYQIKLTISGKYKPIKKMLGDLQKLKNPTIVNDLSFDNSSLTEENIQLNMALTTYFRTEEQ